MTDEERAALLLSALADRLQHGQLSRAQRQQLTATCTKAAGELLDRARAARKSKLEDASSIVGVRLAVMLQGAQDAALAGREERFAGGGMEIVATALAGRSKARYVEPVIYRPFY